MPENRSDTSDREREVEIALAEILKLLDITRDIERNKDDGDFARSGGTISYVFDENVFELFIDPWAAKGQTATFYSPFWHRRTQDLDLGSWPSIAAQTALLASEYLFSNDLPGQAEPKIYVTEWHMWELRARLQSLLEHSRSRIDSQRHPPSSQQRGAISKQPFLKEDLDLLRQYDFAWTSEAIDRFIITRTAAHALATDRTFEPLRQIDRLVSGPLRDSIEGLDALRPEPPDLAEKINAAADIWFDRLVKEDELRIKSRTIEEGARMPVPRPKGSIRTDALSLAYVQWAARQGDRSKNRIVMVTGDEIVFNAYRRWYCTLGQNDPEYLQPFVLRRLVQYAPIFNLNDADGDVLRSNDLFDQTRAAVEVALLPFNLSQLGTSKDRQRTISQAREFLALRRFEGGRLSDNPSINAFASGLTNEWLNGSRAKLDQLSVLWQRTERMAIGSMFNGIQPRLNAEQAQIAARRAEAGAVTLRPGLTEYMKGLLERIVENSVNLWYPLAINFITQSAEASPENDQRQIRPPINLRFRHQRENMPENLGELLTPGGSGSQSVRNKLLVAKEEFAGQPALLFALASTIALARGSWSHAERFAELAKQSSVPHARPISAFDGDGYELLYLHALTKRFRLAEFAPVRSDQGLRLLRRLRNEAHEMLTMCERAPSLLNDSSQITIFKRLRALSERAALNGFYGTALCLEPRGKLTTDVGRLTESRKAFQEAERDLRSCLGLDSQSLLAPIGRNLRDLFGPVRRQYLSNIAALNTIRSVLGETMDDDFMHQIEVLRELEDMLETDQELPDVVRLEIEAYLVLTGARPPATFSKEWRKRSLPLALDDALLKAIVPALPRILEGAKLIEESDPI